MKKICTVLLAAAMLMGAATGASAIDFKAKGQWLVGFGLGETSLVNKTDGKKADHNDMFQANQRVRLQLDAVASEALSGTVYFEIGTQRWGNADDGAALGADGTVVKVKRAYIDWAVPQTDLKFRMGIQGLALPNVAGGSAVMDTDAGAVVASYQATENVGVTAFWARPLNDNFGGYPKHGTDTYRASYLDNMDLFGLMLPVKFDGIEATPWLMYGIRGKNAFEGYEFDPDRNHWGTSDGNLTESLAPFSGIDGRLGWVRTATDKTYGSMFWAGLPVALTLWDPLNIEFDFNYGYVEKMGRFEVETRPGRRASTKREGWLAKALVEYKMDWGVPGIFGWYASGDDGNVKNGSERMPSIVPMGNMTSFMGDGNFGWMMQDLGVDYSGSWGIGAQVRDMSFMEDLSHTLRVAYWGGTNAPSMIKYMDNAYSWNTSTGAFASPYLTTKDSLLEINFINNYKMYENFDINFEVSYLANFIDNDAWRKRSSNGNGGTFSKQDAWKAEVIFAYSF
ncbi:MAG: outer membrane homotrimeric porin [Desulfovibrio sp.]|nr:outer membrane homotrimeric porin [Desulfovibrio sp.]